MGMILDLRDKNVGDEAPGGAPIDLCPRCNRPGIWINKGPRAREAYAHVVDVDTYRVIDGCFLDLGGSA